MRSSLLALLWALLLWAIKQSPLVVGWLESTIPEPSSAAQSALTELPCVAHACGVWSSHTGDSR
jgi:hypothetical protein